MVFRYFIPTKLFGGHLQIFLMHFILFIFQESANHIQLDLEELVKSLNERCKTYGLRAKPTSLVELPFGILHNHASALMYSMNDDACFFLIIFVLSYSYLQI